MTSKIDPATRRRLDRARAMWRWNGDERPPFADPPASGQESVWDYPRPPRLVVDTRHVLIRAGDVVIADTRGALKIQETASPPGFYIPRADIDPAVIRPAGGGSMCEWKGTASYWDVVTPDTTLATVAWSYERPLPPFEALAGCLAFYPDRLVCTIDGERVRPQPGGFYGGWVTDDIAGPVKGESGTGGW